MKYDVYCTDLLQEITDFSPERTMDRVSQDQQVLRVVCCCFHSFSVSTQIESTPDEQM